MHIYAGYGFVVCVVSSWDLSAATFHVQKVIYVFISYLNNFSLLWLGK